MTAKPLPRVPLHDLTGRRVPASAVRLARELELHEELRRLTFALSRERVRPQVVTTKEIA